MATFKLYYNIIPNPFIVIRNTHEITKEQELKLVDIIVSSIEDSWDYDDSEVYLNEIATEDTRIELDGEDLVLIVELNISFYGETSGLYDPGKYYGPIEDCYPAEIDFDDIEIDFREKKYKDLVLDKISKNDILKGLDISDDDIESDCYSLDECTDYEILED